MHNPEWLELIPLYIGQQLTIAQKADFENHLATCDLCQRELKEWRLLASVVQQEGARWASNLPPLRMPRGELALNQPTLEGRRPNGFRNQEEPTYINININVHPSAVPAQRPRLPLTLMAAALLMVIFGGVVIYLLSQGDDDQPTTIGLAPQSITETAQPSPTVTLFGGGDASLKSSTPAPTITLSPLSPSPYFTPQPIAPASSDYCNVYNIIGEPIGIYPWPDLAYSPVDTMQPDAVYQTWVYSGNGWYQIFLLGEGLLGWVQPDYVRIDGNCAAITLPSPTAPVFVLSRTPAPSTVCQLNGDTISLRPLPGSTYDVMAVVRGPLTPLARNDSGWYYVSVDISGALWEGWVSTLDVTVSGPCDDLPLDNSSTTNEPTPMPINP